jgi:hypothetical protein
MRGWPRPISVRDVQAAMSRQGEPQGITREHLARTLHISDRQLELLVSEQTVLDMGAHAYLAEFDLEGDRGVSLDDG